MTSEVVKTRVDKLRLSIDEKRSMLKDRPGVIKGVEYITRFLFGFVLSGAIIFDGYAPFGVGMVAAAGAGLSGLLSFAGLAFGAFLHMGFAGGLRYAGPGLLIYATAFLFHDYKAFRRSWFMPLMSAVMAACTGFVYVLDANFTINACVFFITDVTLIAGSAYFYQIALSPWSGSARDTDEDNVKHTISLIILVVTMLIGLANIKLPLGMALGQAISVIIVLISAYKGGMGIGCVAGCASGLAMDAATGGLAFYTMAYAFSGLIAGVFRQRGRILCLLSYLVASGVVVLWTYGFEPNDPLMYEAVLGSVIFLLLPDGLLTKLGTYLYDSPRPKMATATASAVSPVSPPERPKTYTRTSAKAHAINKSARQHVDYAAEGFQALYETAKSALCHETNDNDSANIFDAAAEGVCRNCARCGSCWTKNYTTTRNALNDATRAMTKRGKLEITDLPSHFVERCLKIEAFIDSVNAEMKASTYRRQLKSRLRENQSAFCGQYSEMYNVLRSISTEMGRDLAEPVAAEPMSASVGIASLRKKGESTSGDCGRWFKTSDGKLYVLLSDGMGSGKLAAEEAENACKILEKFLLASVDPETALRLLNSVMLFKSDEELSCATIDLFCTDLHTGEAKLYKYGAAPSYLKRRENVARITGETVAAGLGFDEAQGPDMVSMKLNPGDYAIIASDGVATTSDDEWLRELAAEYSGTSAKDLSRMILQGAANRYGAEDDMTVVVLYLEPRKESRKEPRAETKSETKSKDKTA